MQIVFGTSLGLFISDGTAAGTALLTVLPQPTGYASVDVLAPLNGEFLFGYQDGVAYDTPSLGLTDLTDAGTAIFTTLPNEGLEADGPPTLYGSLSLGSRVLLSYSPAGPNGDQLWSTDGTAAGTIDLTGSGIYAPILDPGGLLAGGRLVTADSNGIVATDGTASGTFQLKSGPLGNSDYSFHLASLGSIVVFSIESGPDYNDADGGDQLWRSDGTVAGTVLVTDLPTYSVYAGMTASKSFGSKALFAYNDGTGLNIPSLWVTDGTATGTFPLPGITNPQFGAATNGRVFLIAAEGLVVTDGTVAGTQVIAPKSLGPNGFGPTTIMASLGNDAIFAAAIPTSLNNPYDYGSTNQLWVTDGTAVGTKLIETLPNNIVSMTSVGDRVLFTSADAAGNPAVWTTDGTAAGTSILIDNASAYFAPGMAALIAPCFAAGTRIAAKSGNVIVEQLRIGDIVLTASGNRQAVQWIGHRHVDCRRHPDPERVWPIRIAPHAFGVGRPRHPLLLSPDHSVFVEDVLIPIKFLVNGTTVVQLMVDTIMYYHIELPRHDVLFAEGMPVESYLETGGRAAFANGGAVTELHADFTPDQSRVAMTWQNFAYAPLLGDSDQLARTRMKLDLQAAMLGSVGTKQRKRREHRVKAA
jgi:ELWxxDGT repeat protein